MYDETVVLRVMAKAMIQALNASRNSGRSLAVTFLVDGMTQEVNALVREADLSEPYGPSMKLDDRML